MITLQLGKIDSLLRCFLEVANYLIQFVLSTAVCRIMFDLPFYSSKIPILRVVGGAEGVVPHPHMGGSK